MIAGVVMRAMKDSWSITPLKEVSTVGVAVNPVDVSPTTAAAGAVASCSAGVRIAGGTADGAAAAVQLGSQPGIAAGQRNR